MLLIKLRFPLCSLSIVKLLLALGICVFSDSYIVLHPCTDYVLISCSASQPHQIFSPATRLHCAGFTTPHNINFVDQPCSEGDGILVHGELVSKSSYKEKCPALFKYLVPIKQYSFVLEVLRAFTIVVENMARS